jgi:hypothetical protein
MSRNEIRIPKSYLLRVLPLVLGAGIISFILLTSPQTTYADPICGNNITEPGEACDGIDLNGYTCSSVAAGFSGGSLSCKVDCSGYDVSSCDQGNTIEARSCSQGDVQTAIGQAQDGDTVLVPAGHCTWSDTLRLEPMPAIMLQGAGIDQTVITDATPAGGWGNSLFWINGVEDKPFRIAGFTFTDQGEVDPNGLIHILGNNKNWRVDHCKFDDISQRGVRTRGATYGVIDHCTFVIPDDGNVQTIGVVGDGDASWERPLSLGTADAVYAEDCTFDFVTKNDGPFDAYGGARYVFRYNTVTNTTPGHHGRDSGNYRSTHSFEIYGNEIISTYQPGTNIYTALHFRGGTGVVFDNTVTGRFGNGLLVVNYCSCPDMICSWEACTTYPCIDQIGRSSDSDQDGVQDLEPLYEWNNTFNVGDLEIQVQNACSEVCIQEGRDFYNDLTRPDYVPYVYPHPLVQLDLPLPSADLNGDGKVDVLDAQLCTNVVMDVEIDPEIVSKADVNMDGTVNTADVMEIIQGILRK